MLTKVMLPRKPYEKPALRQVGAMSAAGLARAARTCRTTTSGPDREEPQEPEFRQALTRQARSPSEAPTQAPPTVAPARGPRQARTPFFQLRGFEQGVPGAGMPLCSPCAVVGRRPGCFRCDRPQQSGYHARHFDSWGPCSSKPGSARCGVGGSPSRRFWTLLFWYGAFFVAVLARLDFDVDRVNVATLLQVATIAAATQLATGLLTGLYRGRRPIASFWEVRLVVLSTLLATLTTFLVVVLVGHTEPRAAQHGVRRRRLPTPRSARHPLLRSTRRGDPKPLDPPAGTSDLDLRRRRSRRADQQCSAQGSEHRPRSGGVPRR